MPTSSKPFSITDSLLFKVAVPVLIFMLISTLLLGAYLRVSIFTTIDTLISEEVKTDVDNLRLLLSNRLQQVKRAADTIANDQEILTALAGGRDSLLRMDSRAIDLRNRFDLDVLQIFDQNQISRTNILHANLYRVSTLADRVAPNQADLFVIEGRLIYLVRTETPTGGIVIVGIDLLTELERLMKQLKLRDKIYIQHPSLPESAIPAANNHFFMDFQLPVGSSNLTVILSRNIDTYYQIYEKAQNVVISGVLLISLIIFILSLFIVVTIVQPLRKLSHAAQELATADFSQPYQPRKYLNSNHSLLRIGKGDEIGQLVESFARMEQELHHVYSELIRDLERANQDVIESYEATLQSWANALDLRDHGTERHTSRVAELAQEFARYLGLSEEEIVALKRGALLHDVGKMVISDRILNKKTPLTDEEWLTIKQHPLYGYVMLRPIEYLKDSLEVIYCHHEKWDGSGYPQGLKGADIPLKARIFSVIDVFDALITERPYREAWGYEDAIEHIRSRSGTDFDPTIVEKFLVWIETHQSRLIEKYYQKS
ncbi:MAG: HD domain-containing protein [Anaerolineales bacterium]|nr:HD domain-containing protein [Anaerolineales bacterium]